MYKCICTHVSMNINRRTYDPRTRLEQETSFKMCLGSCLYICICIYIYYIYIYIYEYIYAYT